MIDRTQPSPRSLTGHRKFDYLAMFREVALILDLHNATRHLDVPGRLVIWL